VELLRKKGAASADKKAARVAAEGAIIQKITEDGSRAVMLEVNCETDFVAKSEAFNDFAAAVADRILDSVPADVATLMELPLVDDGESVETVRKQLVGGKVGENISVRRFVTMQAGPGEQVAGYLHGHRIGVLVHNQGGDSALARDIAMHVAASRPVSVDDTGVPSELIASEREIFLDQARQSGKPAEIMEKMVEGRMRKFLAEVTLTGQAFVKDPDQTVGQLLTSSSARTIAFSRYEVGEGIEKRSDDFVAEVMAQAKGS
jgi:elongation factor Ts